MDLGHTPAMAFQGYTFTLPQIRRNTPAMVLHPLQRDYIP